MTNNIDKLNELKKLIGKTPLIKINYIFKNKKYSAYAKCEWYNLTGSIKDRIALKILTNAYNNNLIKENDDIIETTSGNTGISFTAIGKYLGHKVIIVMPKFMSEERKKLLINYGAELKLVSEEDGGFLKCLEVAKEYIGFHPSQFENYYNKKAQNETGKEIVKACLKQNIKLDAFISGVGTGGTLMGIGEIFKKYGAYLIAIEPKNSPTLKNKNKIGKHKIEGIGDEFIPKLYESSLVDEIVDISDEEAISISQKLAKELGLGVGISSGANFAGIIKLRNKYNNIFTVFADDNKKYLSTDLSKEIHTKLSNNLKFIDFKVIK